jgi:predicted small integral membrane protein
MRRCSDFSQKAWDFVILAQITGVLVCLGAVGMMVWEAVRHAQRLVEVNLNILTLLANRHLPVIQDLRHITIISLAWSIHYSSRLVPFNSRYFPTVVP